MYKKQVFAENLRKMKFLIENKFLIDQILLAPRSKMQVNFLY